MKEIMSQFDAILNDELEVTLKLRDATSNSHIQDIYDPEPDPYLKREYFERTEEDREDLGLDFMKTENYGEGEEGGEGGVDKYVHTI